MKRQSGSLFGCVVLTASVFGCDVEGDSESLRETNDYCTRWQCGYNTSEVNGRSLQDINLDGQVNAGGIALLGFTAPMGLLGYELDVDGDELVARGGLLGNTTLRGQDLVGGVILLQVNGAGMVPVLISEYQEVNSWAEGGAPVSAYALVYPDELDPMLQRSVCKGTLIDPLEAAVVILAGERYDADSKTVIADQQRWLTLACAGSALAKTALLGYGPNANFAGSGSAATPAQRQATIKMITADYCGTGHSYTVDGTPLAWEDAAGTFVLETEPGASEAVWSASGALCLDTPRVVARGDVACALPTCAQLSVDDGEWMTHLVN